MMAKTVTEARRADATPGTDAINRSPFDSLNPGSDGRISPLEMLSRLERSGLQLGDPRVAEALTGPASADGFQDADIRSARAQVKDGQADLSRLPGQHHLPELTKEMP